MDDESQFLTFGVKRLQIIKWRGNKPPCNGLELETSV